MKQAKNITIFVGFLSICLVQNINGMPQVGRSWSFARPNTTSYNNRWQQKFHTTRSPAQYQQSNWQSNGGWNWLIANNSAPQQSQKQPQWQRSNGTRQFAGGAVYQSEGESLWLNNNQSHPFIQVPDFGNRPNFTAVKQPNRNNSWVAAGNNAFGWRAPQPNYWGPLGTNSTQNIPTTRQPIGYNGWQGNPTAAGAWNIGRSSGNTTVNGQNTGNWYSTASTPIGGKAGWSTPLKPANATTGSGVNSYPTWNSRLPGSTLVTANNNQSAFFSSGPSAHAHNNSAYSFPGYVPAKNGSQLPPNSYDTNSSYGAQLAPLAGEVSWSSNPTQTGLSHANGQQPAQARPVNNSNPYAFLFN